MATKKENTEKKTTTRKTTKKTTETKAKVEKLIETKVEEVKEKEVSALEQRRLARAKQRELRKKISDDLRVDIFCCAANTELIVPVKGSKELVRMKYGDVEYFTVGDLRMLRTEHPKMFEEKYIIPIAVDEKSELELSDVLKAVGLDMYYKFDEDGECEMLYEDTIDFLLDDVGQSEFEVFIKSCDKDYGERIFDRALERFIDKKFNNS